MEIDDSRLEQAHKEMTERVEKYDERLVTVLKNHLGVEQSLNDLLAAASRRWKRRTFAGKIDIAKKLFLPEIEPHVWTVLEAGNDLRNAIAHGHKEGTMAAKMTALRKAYIGLLTPEQPKGTEDLTDTQIVVVAFTMAGSYLVVAADRLAEKRKKKA
jgi:hypothetical protein